MKIEYTARDQNCVGFTVRMFPKRPHILIHVTKWMPSWKNKRECGALINWPSLGPTGPDDAEKFAKSILLAVKYARKIDKQYDKERP